MSKLYSPLIAAALLGAVSAGAAAEVSAPQVSYALAGVVRVAAPENAVSDIVIGLYARVDVDAEGQVTGQGVAIYDGMSACAWEPPHPQRSEPPHCRTDGVVDGSFSISGHVVDSVHRHDGDNPLTAPVFALADAASAERLDYAPLTLSLTLHLETGPAELLSLWGFSVPGVEARTTQAGFAGMHASRLFERAFEIAPVAGSPEGRFASSGDAGFGMPLSGAASVGFIAVDPATLPTATDPYVYLQHPAQPPQPRPFTDIELAAIAAHEAGEEVGGHDVNRDIISGGMQELVEALIVATGSVNPGWSYSPSGLAQLPGAR